MEDVHFNSTRIAGSDRLDSSDVELSIHVSEAFVATLSHWMATHREEEDVDTGCVRYRMSCLPLPKVRFSFTECRRTLRVWVERKMPLSSSHGGRRFVLAFTLGKDEVVCTRPFLVFAKKAKEGVGSKFKYQPTFIEVDEKRASMLALLQQKLGSVEGRSSYAPSASPSTRSTSAPAATSGAGEVLVVPAHPLARAAAAAAAVAGQREKKNKSKKRSCRDDDDSDCEDDDADGGDEEYKPRGSSTRRQTRSSGVVGESSPVSSLSSPSPAQQQLQQQQPRVPKRAKVTSIDAKGSPDAVTGVLAMPNSEEWLIENDLADVYGCVDATCATPGTGKAFGGLFDDDGEVTGGSGCGVACAEEMFGGLLDDFECDLSTPVFEAWLEREAREDIATTAAAVATGGTVTVFGSDVGGDVLNFDALFRSTAIAAPVTVAEV